MFPPLAPAPYLIGWTDGACGCWVKSKSFIRSPSAAGSSRTKGRGSGRPSRLGIEALAAEEHVLDELEIGVVAQHLVVDRCPAFTQGLIVMAGTRKP